MGQAVLDSLLNDIHEHRVWSKRGGNEVRKTWMIGGRLGGERRKVAVPMIAGQRKYGTTTTLMAPLTTHASNPLRIEGSANSICAGSTIGNL